MDFTKRFVGFLKTGKISSYQLLKKYFLEEESLSDIDRLFLQLSEKEKEEFVSEVWDHISEKKQKKLVSILYFENWQKLIEGYFEQREQEQIRILEILGYIPQKGVVGFLINEMKNKKESIRITASTALKKQDPALTLEPMLLALTKPEQWLPSRVFEVLKGTGPGLITAIMGMIEEADIKTQQVMVQLLGELGNSSCLPVLEKLALSPDKYLRKMVVQALLQLKLKQSWPVLIKLLEDSEWQVRMQAAEAIGLLGVAETVFLLEEREKIETDLLVKDCIKEALERIEEDRTPIAVNWVRER